MLIGGTGHCTTTRVLLKLVCEIEQNKTLEKRHKSKKAENVVGESVTEILNTKKIKTTQKIKIKTTKTPLSEQQPEEQVKKAPGNGNQATIRKLSLVVPEVSTKRPLTTTSTTTISKGSKRNETNFEIGKNLTTTFVSDCSPLGIGECNVTASLINATDSENGIKSDNKELVIAEIEIKDTNTTLTVTIPDERSKANRRSNSTRENSSYQTSDSTKAAVQDKVTFITGLTELDEEHLTNSTKTAELKKKKKSAQKKNPTKRKASKRKNQPKRKTKKDKKVKRSKSAPSNSVVDTSAH